MRTSILLLVFSCGLAACSGGDDDGASADASPVGGGAADGSAAGDPDADGVAAPVVLDYREGTADLPLAYMGYQRAGETITELYFELNNLADPGCPDADSPIPPQLLAVSGFDGAGPATHGYDDGVRVAFFDFTGALREEIEPANATAVTLTVSEIDVEAGIAEGTIEVTFGADGTASGPFVAPHCPSLDTDE